MPPREAAATGLTRRQIEIVLAVILVLTAAAIANASAVLTAARWLIALAVVVLTLFRLAALVSPRPKPAAKGAWTGPKPTYSLLIPLYDEADIANELVEAVEALDYPRSKLDVQFVLEADDQPTQTAIARAILGRGSHLRMTIAPPGEPRTKPRALNHALARARGAFIAVFDAEDRPHANQLYAALDAFAEGGPKLAAVQAPLSWWNARDNLLTRQFAIEYAVQFHVILPALARWGWAIPLGGTSNHFRRNALEAVGAWDPHNVTEDADLGFRLAAHRWRVGVIDPGTHEEAVTTMGAWTKQRTRWMKGFMQTWMVRMRHPRALLAGGGKAAMASLNVTIAAAVIAGAVHAPFALMALGLAVSSPFGGPGLTLTPVEIGVIACAYGASLAAGLVGAWRSGQPGLSLHVVGQPIYWLLHAPATVRALIQLAHAPFHWDKTRHGVARRAASVSASAPSPSKPVGLRDPAA